MPITHPKISTGLAFKLGFCLAASTVTIFGLFGIYMLELSRRESESLVLASADRISDIIQGSTRYQMLHNDRDGLYQTIRNIGKEPGLVRIRIFNEEGRISFSTEPTEVGKVVDKSAEACYGCHAQEAPLARLKRPDRTRIFQEADQRVLAQIKPIENEPACSNAACHAHPAGQQILGVIDSHLSLSPVDVQIARHQTLLTLSTAVAVVLMVAISLVFVWVVLHRPVKELIVGTHRLADGDLDHRLQVHSRDELGDLAESFNRMTAELALAHAELSARADTLEENVEEKTRELERTQTVLIGSEKYASLGKLAATVAHEVNNPLFGILTYARLGRKQLADTGVTGHAAAQLDEQLQVIERESRRCGEIMRNLLTFARQAPSRRDRSQLNELVQRAVTLVRHQLELQSISLETAYAPDVPPISCDPGQIQQATLVLLVNACEAMPQGGALRVATEFDAVAGEATVRIKDSGAGIPADVLGSIFEPFFTTKEDQQRTGLGLAVAKSIVEQHGGRILVDSRVGEGTEFRFLLPVAVPELEPAGGSA